jgi:hypothetical protein
MESTETILGEREVWGGRVPFGLSRASRKSHLYAVGQTGVGKSTLLLTILAQDAWNGDGCTFIDPHGDAARAFLKSIPTHRTDDVVIIEPSDLDYPVAINPFYHVAKDDRPLVASNLVSAFKHLWRDSWGPRLEYLLYNSFAAILEAPDHFRPTLLSVPRLFVDATYRHALVATISDPQVKQFWRSEFANWGERFVAEAVSPVQNKVGALISSPVLRNLFGQWRPTISFEEVLAKKRILVVNLAKGEIGEEQANVIGSFAVAGIQAAAMRRSRLHESARPDHYLVIDEFQNFGTDIFSSILSESRKMNLSLTICHQHISQIPKPISEAIFGNVGNLVVFRVGAEDAERLSCELRDFAPHALRNLAKGQVYARLLEDGDPQQAFFGSVVRLQLPEKGNVGNIRAQCQMRYARPRKEVEERIMRWFHATEGRKPKPNNRNHLNKRLTLG